MRRGRDSTGNAPNPVPDRPLPQSRPPPPRVTRGGPSRSGQAAPARSRPRRGPSAPLQLAHGSCIRPLAQRREHDDDLYPPPQPTPGRHCESGRGCSTRDRRTRSAASANIPGLVIPWTREPWGGDEVRVQPAILVAPTETARRTILRDLQRRRWYAGLGNYKLDRTVRRGVE
jgi:hypothetical protein